jgi:tetratricopeptide (TPR) repeat protein
MTRLQLISIFAAILLTAGLFFGFDTKSTEQKTTEIARKIEATSTDFASIETSEKTKISADFLKKITDLESKINSESARTADEIAEIEQTDAAWSVAGATWQIAGNQTQSPEIRDFCGPKSIKAFENAVSLKPSEIAHRVNLAYVYADFATKGNEMKGILMLRELETQNPDNTLILNALGRLAIRTNQWEKAIARFEKSALLDPKNKQAVCLLADAYEGAQQTEKAAKQRQRCAALK